MEGEIKGKGKDGRKDHFREKEYNEEDEVFVQGFFQRGELVLSDLGVERDFGLCAGVHTAGPHLLGVLQHRPG